MAKYRDYLPQLDGKLFLTDGGLETTLIFQDGFDLPRFAAFDLLQHNAGIEALRRYTSAYASIAREKGMGFVLEAPTWRSSTDWGPMLDYSMDKLADVNRKAVDGLLTLRAEFETAESPMVISGCIGPRGDGYDPGTTMTPDEAQA